METDGALEERSQSARVNGCRMQMRDVPALIPTKSMQIS